MRRPNAKNLEMVTMTAHAFGDMLSEVVFIGGSVVDFLITDKGSPPARPTVDVDVLIEVTTLTDYHQFVEALKSRGFKEDQSGSHPFICSLNISGIRVDVLPAYQEVLGFSNIWYQGAIKEAQWFDVSGNLRIRLITSPYFLATKLAAFHDRGNRDYLASKDIEDIVAVIDGRPSIVDEVAASPINLRVHLRKECGSLFEDADFIDSLTNYSSDIRPNIIIERLKAMAT